MLFDDTYNGKKYIKVAAALQINLFYFTHKHFELYLFLITSNNSFPAFPDCMSKAFSVTPDGLGRYSCDECGKIFKHPGSLQHHRHIHRGTHRCPSCGKAFSRRWDMERHLNKSKYGCPANRFSTGSAGSSGSSNGNGGSSAGGSAPGTPAAAAAVQAAVAAAAAGATTHLELLSAASSAAAASAASSVHNTTA